MGRVSKKLWKRLLHGINAGMPIPEGKDRDLLTYEIQYRPTTSFKEYMKGMNITHDDMMKLLDEYSPVDYCKILMVNVIGDNHGGKDTDIMVLVDDINKEVNTDDLIIIEERLASIGYKLTDHLPDYVFVTRNCSGNYVSSSKGGADTQNICFYTYHLHKQIDDKIFTNSIDVSPYDRLRALAKFILDSIGKKTLVTRDTYDDLAVERRDAYIGGKERLCFTSNIWDRFVTDLSHESARDVWKSMAWKIGQLLLSVKGVKSMYTRDTLISTLRDNKIEHTDVIEGLLYRKLDHIPDTFIKHMSDNYKLNIQELYPQVDFVEVRFRLIHLDHIGCFMHELIDSPDVLSDEFCEKFIGRYPDCDGIHIQKYMITPCIRDDLDRFPTLRDRVIWEDQRSDKWCELLKHYRCGNDDAPPLSTDGTVCDNLKRRSHLFRGCIFEDMILENIKEIRYDKLITPGFIVEKDEEDAIGCAPDGLLISGNKITPIEIKVIINNNNSKFMRALKLATNQLERARSLLNIGCDPDDLICEQVLYAFLFIDKDDDTWSYKMKLAFH